MASKRDYYEILDVNRDADGKSLKDAFRRQARRFHPDRSDEENAEERFKEVQEAYAVLSDTEKRRMYDRYGHDVPGGGPFGPSGFQGVEIRWDDLFGGGGIEDIFSSMFGFNRRSSNTRVSRGHDVLIRETIPFDWALHGGEREIELELSETCSACSGSGAKSDADIEICDDCSGKGRVAMTRSMGGFIQQTVRDCPKCRGKGQRIKQICEPCEGDGQVLAKQRVSIRIPEGIESGQRLRLRGRGEPSPQGRGIAGDLLVELHLEEHPWLERQGPDLLLALPVGFSDLVLGSKIEIPHIDSEHVSIKIPSHSYPGKTIVIPNKGLPRKDGRRGDLVILLKLHMPKKFSKPLRKNIESFRDEVGHSSLDELLKAVEDEAIDRRKREM